MAESFAYGLVGHRRYPQPLHGAGGLGFLHHPPLYELTLLTGITAVDDAVGLLHQLLDDGKLAFDAFVLDELDAEAGGQHGQGTQVPPFPRVGVVVGFFQRAQVSEGPGHLVAVAFHVSVVRCRGAYDACYVLGHAGFLCYANYHVVS